jgi:hypothetical protein
MSRRYKPSMLNVPKHWRISSAGRHSPFSAGTDARPLRIVLDDATATGDAASTLLEQFSARPGFELYHTHPAASARVAIGDRDVRGVIPVDYVLPGGGGQRMALASSAWLDKGVELSAREFGATRDEARRLLTLAAACARHEIDALVCNSPLLATQHWSGLAQRARVSTPQDAAALLGLYLRAHNDFTAHAQGGHGVFLDDERFYRGAAVAVLPGYESWLAAAVADRRHRDDPQRFRFLRGMETRLGRALRARDYFAVRIRSARPDDAWNEALFFFDSALLSLGGGLDAAARFLHVTFSLSGDARWAGFAREQWCASLRAAAPHLAGLTDPAGSLLTACARSVGVLRNYVHGEDLSQEQYDDGPGIGTVDYGKGALVLPEPDAERLLAATQLLGDPEAFGLQRTATGPLLVLPASFLARIVPAVLQALGELTTRADLQGSFLADMERVHWLPDVGREHELRLLMGLASLVSQRELGDLPHTARA